jgi:UDP-N-acetylmuramyl tripeptide synthase
VVANADDPLVAWSAGALPAGRVTWVAPGPFWTHDAAGCPRCGGRIDFTDGDRPTWHCLDCDLARPTPDLVVEGHDLVAADGTRRHLALSLPGRANVANAAFAVAAAEAMGIDPDVAVAALASVEDVAGRYRRATLGDTRVRLLMAKNPAGWQEAIDMLAEPPRPVVAAINARIADGRDPSWLWDVPFEALAGRRVVAIGERRHDLAVRLHYAEVDHEVADDLPRALALLGSAEVDYIGNYTAFQDELDRVGRAGGPGRDGAAR